MLPNADKDPARIVKGCGVSFVSGNIPSHFGSPVFFIPRGLPIVLRAAVPEATAHLNHHPRGPENDVSSHSNIRDRLRAHSIPKAHCMKCPTEGQFRVGVAAPIGLH